MKNQPRTIQIFLPYGSPRGVKMAEITNRTVQAIFIPRNDLDKVSNRIEVHNVGLYFLFGQDEEDSKPRVYIGEAEECYKRLQNHNREKDFWEYAVVFVTNNAQNQFTKTDVKFLENMSFTKANEIKRYYIEQTIPTQSFVPEWRKADLEDIFETITILLSTLGFPVFEPMRKSFNDVTNEIYYCKGKEANGKGEYNEDGFTVFKGSVVRNTATKGFKDYLKKKREKLINENIIQKKGEQMVFVEDYQFSSPSLAASILLGRNANGWISWKNNSGKTLDELKRQ